MENVVVTQAIVSQEQVLDPNQTVENIAFFNSDGTPKDLTGDSAYDIAVENGFVGTEEEWVASLSGGANVLLGTNLVLPDLPWSPSPAMTGNLWNVDRFVNYPFDGLNHDLEPFLLADGTEKHSRTRVDLGNLSGTDYMFRLSFNVDDWPEGGGWATIKMHLGPNGSTDGGFGTETQLIASDSKRYFGRYIFEWSAEAADGSAFMELKLSCYNNMTSGYLRITDVKLERVAQMSRPLLVSRKAGPTTNIYTQLYDPINDVWKMARTEISDDGDLEQGLKGIVGYTTTDLFSHNPADPMLIAVTESVDQPVNQDFVDLPETTESATIRINNNDQIIGVYLEDGETLELRCNTHDGETLKSSAPPDLLFQLDTDEGAWSDWDNPTDCLQTTRRFRFVYNTEIETSEGLHFADVNHACIFFPDGMMRMDRTTTFLEDITTDFFLEWMSSMEIDVDVDWDGRLGRGLLVQGVLKPDLVHKFAMHHNSQWSVFKEPTTGLCFGNIFDRDSVLRRDGVTGFSNQLQRLSFIVKNYHRLMLNPTLLASVIPAGTVWSATHWSYTYAPSNATDWHLEIAIKSADLDTLKLMYPVEPISPVDG